MQQLQGPRTQNNAYDLETCYISFSRVFDPPVRRPPWCHSYSWWVIHPAPPRSPHLRLVSTSGIFFKFTKNITGTGKHRSSLMKNRTKQILQKMRFLTFTNILYSKAERTEWCIVGQTFSRSYNLAPRPPPPPSPLVSSTGDAAIHR